MGRACAAAQHSNSSTLVPFIACRHARWRWRFRWRCCEGDARGNRIADFQRETDRSHTNGLRFFAIFSIFASIDSLQAYGDRYRGMYPSVGGSDEFIRLFLFKENVTHEKLVELEGKLTGAAEEGESICLKLVKLSELWKFTSDAKALSALALYRELFARNSNEHTNAAPVKLYYFPRKGRAEQIRLLFAELGVEYEDVPIGTLPGQLGFAEAIQSNLLPFNSIPVVHFNNKSLPLAQGPVVMSYFGNSYVRSFADCKSGKAWIATKRFVHCSSH
jgi:hypothetical protein